MIPVVQHAHSALGTDRDGHRKFGSAAKVEIVPVAEFPALVLGSLSLFGRVAIRNRNLKRCIFCARLLPRNCFPLIVKRKQIAHCSLYAAFPASRWFHNTAALSNMFSEK